MLDLHRGDDSYQITLGMFYEKGEHGLTKDISQAFHLYRLVLDYTEVNIILHQFNPWREIITFLVVSLRINLIYVEYGTISVCEARPAVT